MALIGWATHVLQWRRQSVLQYSNMELIAKSRLSSDCPLQLEGMKLESLVIVDQHATVNTFSGLVHTARHTMEVGLTLRR